VRSKKTRTTSDPIAVKTSNRYVASRAIAVFANSMYGAKRNR
jgi:hypothetical protein